MKIETNFDIGEIVYLITDNEQLGRMITAIKITGNNNVTYLLSYGTSETWHYEIEFSLEENIIKRINER